MLKNFRINHNEKGFTLIELMIVIAIIGILSAIAIPNFIAYRDKSFCSTAESDANSVAGGIADYFAIPSNASFTMVTGQASISFPESQTIGMSGKNLLTTTEDSSTNTYTITVTDGSLRCPDAYVKAQKETNGEGWKGTAGTDAYFKKTL